MLSLLLAIAAKPMAPQTTSFEPIPFTEVRIQDGFWAPKQKVNREITIPHTFKMCVDTGRIANFDLAAANAQKGHVGYVFDDSDVYKCLEAAAYALADRRDPKLEAQVDAWIAKIAAAQRPDGYLDTAYQIGRLDKRFTSLSNDHELYCAGHLFEAAVAHYQATGKRSLLTVATKLADLLCATFGEGPGKRMGYPGHPEAELALIKLWRVTGERRYFDLAKFFLNNRGSRFFAEERGVPKDTFDGTYWLDDVPITEHREIKGHAVRAAYLFSGAADVAAVTHDPKWIAALDRVWKNTVFKRVFVTGGIGPSASNEGFTVDYDLPNRSAYQETCASVAMALWNHRLGLLHGDGKYWDWVERALYNGFLSGVSLKGDKFFYVNPLASSGDHHREPWFGCACCPPNVTRTLASLGQYVYAKGPDSLAVNLYVQSAVTTKVNGVATSLTQTTNAPWDSKVALRFPNGTAQVVALKLRIPEWSPNLHIKLNGKPLNAPVERRYAVVRRKWAPTDVVELSLNMAVQRIQAHPEAKEDLGRTALQRGPLMYCLEEQDQSAKLSGLSIPIGATFETRFRPDLLGGVVTLSAAGVDSEPLDWRGALYLSSQTKPAKALAIPYYAWDNRKPTPMEVWIPVAPPVQKYLGPESTATLSLSYTSSICQPDAIRDGKDILGSNKHPGELCHFWPHKGGAEWVAYAWKEPVRISGASVYWFDDTGVGECRLPASWRIEYLDAGAWKPVRGAQFPVTMDRWDKATFEPVVTRGLRLAVQLKEGWSVGIHEWHVIEDEE